MTAAWTTYRAGEVPELIEPRMTAALEALAESGRGKRRRAGRQAAIDVAQWSLDLQLRYRPPAEIDLARFDLWAAQLTLDASAGDVGAVGGDFFTLDHIRDRILNTLDGTDRFRVDTEVQKLQVAAADHDLAAASDAAERLRDTLGQLQE